MASLINFYNKYENLICLILIITNATTFYGIWQCEKQCQTLQSGGTLNSDGYHVQDLASRQSMKTLYFKMSTILKDRFQPLTDKIREIFVSTAYYDARFIETFAPLSLRVTALAKYSWDDKRGSFKAFSNNIFCDVGIYKNKPDTTVNKNSKSNQIIKVVITATWRHLIGTGTYRFGTLDCDLTNTSKLYPNFVPISLSVGVEINANVHTYESSFDIRHIPAFSKLEKINIAACVKPIHDLTSSNRLIEFIEVHTMHGVDQFYIYYISASSEVNALLKWYKENAHKTVRRRKSQTGGLTEYTLKVELISWELPNEIAMFEEEYSYKLPLWGQEASENECIMRSAAAGFTHVAKLILGDFFLPLGNYLTLQDLLGNIYLKNSQTKINGFSFLSVWFDPGSYYNDSNHSSMETLTVFRTLKSGTIIKKYAIVNLRYTFVAGIHHPDKFDPSSVLYIVNATTEGVVNCYQYPHPDLPFDIVNLRKQNATYNNNFLKFNVSRNAVKLVQKTNWM